MTNKILYKYDNGSDIVTILEDWTKIREHISDINPIQPESIDFKITNYCNAWCEYCHENSTIEWKHGKLDDSFFDWVMPWLEVAIGWWNPLDHPDLISFLRKLKKRGIITNITINSIHLTQTKYIELTRQLFKENLVYWVGISYNYKFFDKIPEDIKNNKNVVVHVIMWLVALRDFKILKGYKLLVLWYKVHWRGIKHKIHTNLEMSAKVVYSLLGKEHLCFDNLAIKQLNLLKNLRTEVINDLYMWNDWENTFYIDIVKQRYSITSYKKFNLKIEKTLKECYKNILQLKNLNNNN